MDDPPEGGGGVGTNQTGSSSSAVSMKNEEPLTEQGFSTGHGPFHARAQTKPRPVSPVPSCVSIKSNQSMVEPGNFSSGLFILENPRPVSPVPSCVSMKSDRSMIEPWNFRSGPAILEKPRPVSPVPSCVSMKSDRSMIEPWNFRSGPAIPENPRPVSPVPSCVSMKSDRSMFDPPTFSSGPPHYEARPVSPVPSCVSMKSNWSMFEPPTFSNGPPHYKTRPEKPRPVSPMPSCVSMNSNWSMFEPPTFSSGLPPNDTRPGNPRPVSPVPSCVSMKSNWSMFEPPTFSSGPPHYEASGFKKSLTSDRSRCGVCEQPLSSPVITTCGHSFCSQCISSYWSQSGPSGDYTCPQCRQRCGTQPVMNPDTNMAQPFLNSNGPTAQPFPHVYASRAQPSVYPHAYVSKPNPYQSGATAQPTVIPSASMTKPNTYHPATVIKATANPSAHVVHTTVNGNIVIGQPNTYLSAAKSTVNPSRAMSQPTGNPFAYVPQSTVYRSAVIEQPNTHLSAPMSTVNLSGAMEQSTGNPSTTVKQHSANVSATMTQPTLYRSATMPQHTVNPSATMLDPSPDHQSKNEQLHLTSSTSMPHMSPYQHIYPEQQPLRLEMGQYPLHLQKSMAQPFLQPPEAIGQYPPNSITEMRQDPVYSHTLMVQSSLQPAAAIGQHPLTSISVIHQNAPHSRSELRQDPLYLHMPMAQCSLQPPEVMRRHPLNSKSDMRQDPLYPHKHTVQSSLLPAAAISLHPLHPNSEMVQHLISSQIGQHRISSQMGHHRMYSEMGQHLLYSEMGQHLLYPQIGQHLISSQMGHHRMYSQMGQHPLYSEMGQHLLYSGMGQHLLYSGMWQNASHSSSEMGKGPINPHKHAAQPSLQPPLVQHTAGSYHVLTEQATVTRARTAGDCDLNSVQMSHKAKMKRRFESISEGIIRKGAQTFLNKIYTELYITEGESDEVNNEHEVWQVEAASRPQTTDDTPINCNDIFKPLPGQEGHIRTVMTKGIAGIGKTVSVQKFILDWAEENANQDVDFMFVLPFRELNLVKNTQYSLDRLLLDFHPELSELENSEYKDCNIIFIFDGLDESRLPLDFQKNQQFSDVTQLSPMDVLMTSLIQGALLPSARLWITSRPAAANQIPSQCVDLVTEVRGFSDRQKEEYLRKRISDHSLADRLITHIKASRSLFVMCHMPVFCWIAATVLQQILEEDDSGREAPKTLTEMFIHFLLIQTTRKHQKYQEETEADRQRLLESHKSVILKLAELAYTHLDNGNLIFYDDDLRRCGIDISEASVYSGMCTEIFREECVFEHQKVYCFVHLSIQEFLAALHVFSCYLNKDVKVLRQFVKRKARTTTLPELLKTAVNKALESKNGHLDLFVRFLHGISLTSNHGLLLGLLPHTHSSPESVKKTIKNLKEMQRPNISPERCINLFHCLVEMHDSSVHDEIQAYLKAEKGSVKQLSLAHCSALAHMLLMSEEVLDEFDLKKYKTTEEGRRRLVPVVRCCRKAILSGWKLTEASCETVASTLQSANYPLRELDLSLADLQTSLQKLLSAFQSPHCKLEKFRLCDCNLTDESYKALASALPSCASLTHLDLTDNNMSVHGVQLLYTALHHTNCKLQTLRISPNYLSGDGCVWLAFTLMSTSSAATRLDLDDSTPTSPAQELLLASWRNPEHVVERLRLSGCQLTDKSCEVVANALQSPNPLLEIDLSNNDLGDLGLGFICKGLSSPHCNLQTLRLSGCQISPKGCSFLASALKSNPSYLRELDLTYNHPGGSGVRDLTDRLNDPNCKLETLRFDHGGECRMKPGPRKYACELTLDPNTAYSVLSLSKGNRKVTWGQQQQYPAHPDRFNYWEQVLCREGLSGRCYWEAECSGFGTAIAVAYKSIQRKGVGGGSGFGLNDKCWSLQCHSDRYTAWHNNKRTDIPSPSPRSSRVGVYLDWPAGTLSFYSVSSDTLTHLHTFHSTFTQPLYPGFYVDEGSVSLCQIT